MPRSLLACLVVFSLTLPLGCRMCASPYDECGPVPGGTCSGACDSNARAGSVLSGVSTAIMPDEGIEPQPPASKTPAMPTPQTKSPSKPDNSPPEGWKSSQFSDPSQSETR